MKRFFYAEDGRQGSEVLLDRDESHHLERVMRLRVGDQVELLNGCGSLLSGRIEQVGQRALIRIIEDLTPAPVIVHPLWVCQADLKSKKMDELIQRCTELGVQRFIPFYSGRSQGRLEEKRQQRRQQRWQATIRSACKQSGRLSLMQVDEMCSFDVLLEREWLKDAWKIILWEQERNVRLGDLRPGNGVHPVCLMLGPEGGYALEEVERAVQQGWQSAHLGSQILRAETAALAAVSITQHLLGNI